MSGNNIGLNAGVPNLAAWPGSASPADVTAAVAAEAALRTAADAALQAQITKQILSADAVNPTFGTPLALGFTLPITSGKKYSVRAFFRISYTSTGGVAIAITHPGMSSGTFHARGSLGAANTYTEVTNPVGASPLAIASFVTFAGTGIAFIELIFTASGTGNLDFTLSPGNGGQTGTVHAGSYAEIVASV